MRFGRRKVEFSAFVAVSSFACSDLFGGLRLVDTCCEEE